MTSEDIKALYERIDRLIDYKEKPPRCYTYYCMVIDDDGSDGDIDIWLHSESPKLEEYKNKTGIRLHVITPDRLVGEVKIINYHE